ncbi:MAG: pyrimidine-nucleoside phosphorylase [Clostridia bacterium]|nr:pyrimidine-nucleoside phosphorylase [Clostridia bacterium]
MRTVDIIEKKKLGQELTDEEIAFFIKGYTEGTVPDYQASALAMAVYFQDMSDREISTLTLCMRDSGDTVDLSDIPGIKVDKHSTGGVGDKVTMIVAPIAAACGVPIAKMSGRGLGFTGGTIDKLESIPGLSTAVDNERFFKQVKDMGIAVVGQTGNLCPADKKLYALRDVTATIDSIPMIASSIMSKKLAAGSDRILLDVTTGSGAFMKSTERAMKLAERMVAIGTAAGRKTVAIVTDMNTPLGRCVGNRLEVMEAVDALHGKAETELMEICLTFASNMILLGEKAETIEEAESMVERVISDGSAYKKFRDMVMAQGGDVSYIDDISKLELAPIEYEIKAAKSGYIHNIDALAVGEASMLLGAGRETKDDNIDFGAGIYLEKLVGDYVNEGDTILRLYTSDKSKISNAGRRLEGAIVISENKPEGKSKIIGKVE